MSLHDKKTKKKLKLQYKLLSCGYTFVSEIPLAWDTTERPLILYGKCVIHLRPKQHKGNIFSKKAIFTVVHIFY